MVARHRMAVVLHKVTEDVQRHLQTGVLDRLTRLDTTLTELRQSGGEEGESGLQAALAPSDQIDTESVAGELLRGVQGSIDELPETVEIIAEESYQELETRQYGQVESLSIELQRLVDYVVETELVEPFQERLADLPSHALRGWRAAGDIARLVRFRLESAEREEDEEGAEVQDSLEAIIDTCRERLEQERAPIEEALMAFRDASQTLLGTTFEKLDPYVLTRFAGSMGHYIRAQEGRRMILGFEVRQRRLRTLLSHTMVRLLYRHSEGVLLARRLHEVEGSTPTRVGDTLDLVEALMPAPRVLSSLPLYYRQLFTGKQPIGEEYWVGRRESLKRAATAVRRHQQGYSGALLVVGERDAGKTALCRRIASAHIDGQHIYRLPPPEGGSADPSVFRSRLLEALGAQGDARTALASLPRDSAVVLPDLELWWERHPHGYAVIDEILRLVEEFSDHCLFVADVNIQTFRFLVRVRPLSRAFLDVIECEPFDAEELQEAILLRHRSTGLRFELGGRHEDQLTDFSLARFFSSVFEHTAGNVGFALRAWLTCIEEVAGEQLQLRRPGRPSLQALDRLGDEDRVWLQQLVLHKQLSSERLARLFRTEDDAARRRAAELKRMGLVVESQAGVLEINPYIHPLVTEQLDRGGIS